MYYIIFCRECWSILQEKQWNNDQHRKDFESGVRMGVGAFNLLISLLPARVMKVLEFIGFAGNRVSSMFHFDFKKKISNLEIIYKLLLIILKIY